MSRFLVLLLALQLAFAPVAAASDVAVAYLRAARVLYEKLEYEKALEQVRRARASTSNVEDDVQISLWEGILLLELDQAEPARLAFATALALRPAAVLPVMVSPKIRDTVETIRAQIKADMAKRGTTGSPSAQAPADAALGPAAATTPAPTHAAPAPQPRTETAGASGPAAEPAGGEPRVAAADPKPVSGGARGMAWLPLALGGAGAVTGTITAALAQGQLDRLRATSGPTLDDQQARETAALGERLQATAITSFCVAGAGLVSGVLMLAFGGPSQAPQVSVAPTPHGVVFSAAGAFP